MVDHFCIIYLNDILVFLKTTKEYDEHLRRVCQQLYKAELYTKPSKYKFYKEEIEFLGFIVNCKGIKIDPNHIRTIKE